MKLALLCLCIVQLAFGSRQINDREAAARGDVPLRKASHGTGECVGKHFIIYHEVAAGLQASRNSRL